MSECGLAGKAVASGGCGSTKCHVSVNAVSQGLWLISSGVGAAIGVFVLCYPLRFVLARLGAVDCPNERSSHRRPTLRGGGMAVLFVVLSAGLIFGRSSVVLLVLLGVALGLAALSFWDDLRPLPASMRFGGHAFAALCLVQGLGCPSVSLSLDQNVGLVLHSLPSWLLILLWITGYTNAFNFMDGINGIAAGQAAITGLGMALLGVLAGNQSSVVSPTILLSSVIAGAALGFLPHNFPSARMFMGDVGSATLGFLLAALVVWLARDFGWWLMVPMALLHANFVLDSGITLLRRILRGERWYEAHREHFYQRLVRSGKSHAFVTGLEMILQVIILALMVLYLHVSTPARLCLIVLVVMVWLTFFTYCERSFRRSFLNR